MRRGVLARARPRPIPGTMNRLEQSYAAYLELSKRLGKIFDYDFEPMKLRLADRTFYTPDFRVLMPDGIIEMHEVKGFWEDDARVKIKVAAEHHPFRFVAVTKAKGVWDFEYFAGAESAGKTEGT